MTGAEIAAILYALTVLGQTAARGLQQLQSEGMSDEAFRHAWEQMRGRLGHAEALWRQAVDGSEAAVPEPAPASDIVPADATPVDIVPAGGGR
jgi:hypothetical protein